MGSPVTFVRGNGCHCDVIYSMLRHGTSNEEKGAQVA
jgi:hypothetical protein